MNRTQATVRVKEIEYDIARRGSVDFVAAGTVPGVFIPTGGSVVQKQYGQEYAGDFEFYTKKKHSGLAAGNQLQINSINYDIVAIRDYVKAITVLLKQEVPSG